MVGLCLKFLEGKCPFENEFCWFIHNKTIENIKFSTDECNDIIIEEEVELMDTENESVFQQKIEELKTPSK